MSWTRILTLVGALLLPVSAALAQGGTGTVSGTVVDAQTARPLADVAVTVVGTQRSTVTSAEGRYTLTQVPAGAHTVRASRPGYAPADQAVTVAAGQTATASFRLQTSAVQLQEVVAVGYGQQRRRDITGAVSSVNTQALENAPVQSLDQLLQGTAAGVNVTTASSAPGGGISIRVRGTASITGNSEPLYVIDGFPIENDPESASPGNGGTPTGSVPSNPLAALNPQDIESIEVLKDASATAIYGARGANGVVLITTKKGRAGRPQFTFDAYTGVQDVARRYDLLGARELAIAMNEAAADQNQAPPFSQAVIDTLGAGTDWQDAIFRNAPVRSLQATVSGGSVGTAYTRYAVSGGYFDQEGVVTGSSFERYSLRANVEQGFSARLKFGANLTGSRVNTKFVPTDGESNRRAGAVGTALQAYPFLPVQLPSGVYPYQGRDLAALGISLSGASELPNPVSMATQVKDDLGDTRVLGNAYGEYELLRGLRARVSLGGDYSGRFRDTYYPRTTRRGEEAQGEAIRGRTEILSWLNENTLTYEGGFGEAHRFTLLGGYTRQTAETARNGVSGSRFVTDATGYNDISAAQQLGTPSSDRQRWALQSWLGRLNYTLLDRYLLTVTGRYDGSSRFGKGSKWGFFPSVALGWRVSDEPFLRGSDLFDELKLRASYGVAGNPAIRPYQSLARLIATQYSFGGNPVTGYFPVGVANDDLTWESTTQLDVGVDAAFLGRFTLTADYYHKKTDDLLLTVDLPSESGFARALVNAGSVENRGVELAIRADVLQGDRETGALRWNTGLTFARNRNEVVDLAGDTEIRASTISDDFKLGGTVVRVGEPIGVFVGYRTAGIVRDSAHAASLAGVTNRVNNRAYQPGDVIFDDVDGNDTIDVRDRTVIGSPHPDFTLGWTNTVAFRGFELSTLVQGAFGNEILNLNLWRLTGGDLATNVLRERYEDRWTPTNPDAKYPRFGVNTVGAGTTDYNDLILEDGSYLRLKTVSLSYGLPASWLRGRGLSSARVYVTGSNLLTWTDYRGFDPEVSSFGVGNLNRGIDIGAYPSSRSVIVGVNLGY
ncbi:MAG TPA: TonB-dependent receptor [Longimicrobium sp.]|jgi:TonB-linked SusC/RagA family outer membrane protein